MSAPLSACERLSSANQQLLDAFRSGLRSEWVSTALIVWVVATGVKRNALSALSGMPYVRLLDYHKTLGWACCFFAGVHTVAMMIRVERQGAPWSYTWETSPISYGWAAWVRAHLRRSSGSASSTDHHASSDAQGSLVSLFWLCVASLGPIRRLSHEWFYVLHMAGVLLFIVFMYYHCFDALVSWPLMHAATVVLGAAVVYRFVQLFVSKHAVVEVIADGALRIRVDVRYRFVWTAGQHVFVRFTSPALAPWQTHPFTVANVPAHSLVAVDAGHPLASADVEKQAPGTAVATAPERPSSASSTLDLVLRPHSGLTRRLFERASAAPGGRFTAPVVLDGPYSSDSSDQLSVSASDRALVVAGGTGLSYALPLILVALGGTRGQAPSEPLRAVDVAWAVRHASCVEWYSEMLARTQAIAHARGVDLSITLYVSRPGPDDGEMSGTATASSASSSKAASDGIKVVHGRPDGAALIKAAAELSARRLVVVSALALSFPRWLRSCPAPDPRSRSRQAAGPKRSPCRSATPPPPSSCRSSAAALPSRSSSSSRRCTTAERLVRPPFFSLFFPTYHSVDPCPTYTMAGHLTHRTLDRVFARAPSRASCARRREHVCTDDAAAAIQARDRSGRDPERKAREMSKGGRWSSLLDGEGAVEGLRVGELLRVVGVGRPGILRRRRLEVDAERRREVLPVDLLVGRTPVVALRGPERVLWQGARQGEAVNDGARRDEQGERTH